MKYSITDGQQICKKLCSFLEPLNFCCGLTGSALFNCVSDNDIDIIIYPLKTEEPFISDELLMEKLKVFLDATNYNQINYHEKDKKHVWYMKLSNETVLNFFILL